MIIHKDKNILLLYFYQELPANDMQAVKEHLRGCSSCKLELAQIRETLKIYKEMPLETPPRRLLSNIFSRKKFIYHLKPISRSSFDLLLAKSSLRWAISIVFGILLVLGIGYFPEMLKPSKSSNEIIEQNWDSDVGDSIESISRTVSLFKEKSNPLFDNYVDTDLDSVRTIEYEISELNNRITKFSKELTYKFF